jgi:hypothetical protein
MAYQYPRPQVFDDMRIHILFIFDGEGLFGDRIKLSTLRWASSVGSASSVAHARATGEVGYESVILFRTFC